MTTVERAAYQRGMEAARSAMVLATADVTEPAFLAVLSIAFRAVSEEIARVNGVVPAGHRVDYLSMVQEAARQNADEETGVGGALQMTPIGKLFCGTEKRGDSWRSWYKLNGERVTVRQIKALGLAQRPTTRVRKRKDD